MVQALSDGSPEVLQIDGVNGIDIGLDESGELMIRVLVTDPANPPSGLPTDIGGYGVTIIAGEPMTEFAVVPDQHKYDPVVGGSQLGPRTVVGGLAKVGTLGCVFADAQGAKVAVSNAHVLCGTAGDVVQQPAPSTDPPPVSERLGTVSRCEFPNLPTFLPLPGSAPVSGVWDAAVCLIDASRSANVGEIADLGMATGIGSPVLGEIVRKRGYRTRVTHGIVEGLFGSYMVRDSNGNPLWWMLGQVAIVIIPDISLNPDGIWSDRGDSGSVVLNQANEIIALHWGGDNNGRGYASDFSTLSIALGLFL
jgi:hypothetical protein